MAAVATALGSHCALAVAIVALSRGPGPLLSLVMGYLVFSVLWGSAISALLIGFVFLYAPARAPSVGSAVRWSAILVAVLEVLATRNAGAAPGAFNLLVPVAIAGLSGWVYARTVARSLARAAAVSFKD